jgi:hypothetical protein
MAYVTLSDLREYLGLETADTGDDSLLQTLINDAQSIIDEQCGKSFESSVDAVRYYDAISDVRGRTLRLRDDLAQITSITHGNGTYTLSASDYTTKPRDKAPYYEIVLRRTYTQPWSYSADSEVAIAITGRWAYSVTAPRAIARATERLAAYLYRQKDNTGDLDRAVVAGNATVLPQRLPSDVMRYLRPYLPRT